MKEARLQVPGLHLDRRAVRKRRGSRSREQGAAQAGAGLRVREGRQGQQQELWGGGGVLYFDCGAGYVSVFICLRMYPKK